MDKISATDIHEDDLYGLQRFLNVSEKVLKGDTFYFSPYAITNS